MLEKTTLPFQPHTWQGSSSPWWCRSAATYGQWTVCFLFQSTNLIPSRSWWSTKDTEAAADVNLPPGSLCWPPRMFSWHFQLECSINLRNNSPTFKKLALGLERRVVYHNNYGHFSRRVGLSVCFHALVQRANVTNSIFCSKVRWLPCSKISLKKIFVIELEKKKIGLSLSLIFL